MPDVHEVLAVGLDFIASREHLIFVERAQRERAALQDDTATEAIHARFDDLQERLGRLEAMLSRSPDS